jgi:hypothetical protein
MTGRRLALLEMPAKHLQDGCRIRPLTRTFCVQRPAMLNAAEFGRRTAAHPGARIAATALLASCDYQIEAS